jgi:DNA (cytosine-5)-methyltransferase 1
MLRHQGLPETWLDESPFSETAKRKMLGNGVPLPMGRAIARAVKRAMQRDEAVS